MPSGESPEVRILYLADARSPIARGWVEPFVSAGHEVHWISTFPSAPPPGLASFHFVPVGFSRAAASTGGAAGRIRDAGGIRAREWLRHWLAPLTVSGAARAVRDLGERIRPDLVHALRLPLEGILAAEAGLAAPLMISLWGNDLTLHAPASPVMRRSSGRALRAADGMMADCRRDVRVAGNWGLRSGVPSGVFPGNGGIRPAIFHPAGPDPGPVVSDRLRGDLAALAATAQVVVNPRGFRGYVRNDTFFEAAGRIAARRPSVVFLCPAMAGEPLAERWAGRSGLQGCIRLLPKLEAADMAAVFQRSLVSVSPTQHDGTPNTLLEAMACGAFPVCGDLESIREWIDNGVNGSLVDPTDAQALAGAIEASLQDDGLRQRAARRNQDLIHERAVQDRVFAQAEQMCLEVAQSRRTPPGARV
jgi:glycosyltransferase involved in cell wall biosynthesis